MASKKAKRGPGDPQGATKRAKLTQPPADEFSLTSVVCSMKHAAAEHSHLPPDVVTKLFQKASVSFLTTDKASWVYLVPHWYQHVFEHATAEDLRSAWEAGAGSQAETDGEMTWSQMFQQAWDAHPQHYESIKMFGKMTKIPRFQLLCGDMGSYRFSGMTYEAQQKFPRALEHAVQHMKRIVEDPATNCSRLTGGLVNWYENGDHYIGAHADDERDMMEGSPIVALSLGATRRFVFTRKVSKRVPKEDEAVARLEIQVEDGDLMVMGGKTQKTHKHAVPKMARCREPRISITLRCFH